MAITLDPATEQRIQRELDRGHYGSPAEEEWLEMNKSALNTRLKQSMAQIERGEGIPGDRLLEALAKRRQVETAAEFFKHRATRAKGKGLMHFRVNAPDHPEPHSK